MSKEWKLPLPFRHHLVMSAFHLISTLKGLTSHNNQRYFNCALTTKEILTDDVSTYVLRIYGKSSFCSTESISNIDTQNLHDLLL